MTVPFLKPVVMRPDEHSSSLSPTEKKAKLKTLLSTSWRSTTNHERPVYLTLGGIRPAPFLPNAPLSPTAQSSPTFPLVSPLLQGPTANGQIRLQVKPAVLQVFPFASVQVAKTKRLCQSFGFL